MTTISVFKKKKKTNNKIKQLCHRLQEWQGIYVPNTASKI